MLYVILGRDAPASLERRGAQRAAHSERIRALVDAGRLILAGPLPAIDAPDPGPAGYIGSLIVAEFGSREEAEAWVRTDPYVSGGVWGAVEVRPFLQSAP